MVCDISLLLPLQRGNYSCNHLQILWKQLSEICRFNHPNFHFVSMEGCQLARIRESSHHKIGVLVLRDTRLWIREIHSLMQCCVFHFFISEKDIIDFQKHMGLLVDLDFSLSLANPDISIDQILKFLPNSRYMILSNHSRQVKIFVENSFIFARLPNNSLVPHMLLKPTDKDLARRIGSHHLSNIIARKDLLHSSIIIASKSYIQKIHDHNKVSNIADGLPNQLNGSLTWLMSSGPEESDLEVGSWPCVQKSIIFLHEKININELEGGDFRIISLASRISRFTCQKPTFAVRELLSSKNLTESFLKKYGLSLGIAGFELEKIFPGACQHTKYDLAIVGVWFWRVGMKSMAELASTLQSKNCIANIVGLTDDIHWIRMTQGLLRNAFSNVSVPRSDFENILEIKEHELNVYAKLDHILTVNDADAHSIGYLIEDGYEKSCPVSHAEVKHAEKTSAQDAAGFLASTRKICFSGSGHLYNEFSMHWFLKNVFPKLIAGVELHIFGDRWAEHFCSREGVICSSKKDYSLCRLCIAPTQIAFSGIVTKISEYLDNRKTVVSNYIGAYSFANNPNVILANTAEQFVEQLNKNLVLESASDFLKVHESYKDESLPPCLISLLQ